MEHLAVLWVWVEVCGVRDVCVCVVRDLCVHVISKAEAVCVIGKHTGIWNIRWNVPVRSQAD